MKITPEQLARQDIALSALGIEPCGAFVPHYCTPEGARVIGCAGVDGIHYCTIPAFGDMIFAVSPMNFGDCVHPVARNFTDLLQLLLSCADMAALEQCYAWDRAQFDAFLLDNPPTTAQRAVLDALRQKLGLVPMEDAFAYVKALQAGFDCSQIPYTADYYDTDMNPAAPATQEEWRVSYDGGFWNSDGAAGVEVTLGKTFRWGKEHWRAPAIYLCSEGVVLDLFVEAAPDAMNAYIRKWDLHHEDEHHYTQEEQEQLAREHPLNADFTVSLTLNGQAVPSASGCGTTWLPAACLPQGTHAGDEARRALEHYGLSLTQAWGLHRCCFRLEGADALDIRSLSIRLERRPAALKDAQFTAAVGEQIELVHPLSGKCHVLTVQELEQQEMPERAFADETMEYPRHVTLMSYTLAPDITGRGFLVQDCAEGDRPRRKASAADSSAPQASGCAATIGIIGGADGPTAVVVGADAHKLHAACSALHFAPVERVQWRAVFFEKLMEDVSVQLI